MLLELQVKNLALIEQAQVEFGEGLNILTGETGAGKSIIIGSVNMALGEKPPKTASGRVPTAPISNFYFLWAVMRKERRSRRWRFFRQRMKH